MVLDIIKEYPSIVHFIPLALLGFWTQLVWVMRSDDKKLDIIVTLDTNNLDESVYESDLIKDGKWLYLWLLGVGIILALRFVVVWYIL